MKIRNGFVSNSSSSSFIVIGSNVQDLQLKDETLEIGRYGETDFGWGPETIFDMHSRINFCLLQALYSNDDRNLHMLLDTLRNVYNDVFVCLLTGECDEKITEELERSKEYGKEIKTGYIDHQSSAVEDCNIEMFESKDALCSFIFARDSYIELDNDNR